MGQKVINMILCMLNISFSCFVQWNLDETKAQGSSSFIYNYFTITGVRKS